MQGIVYRLKTLHNGKKYIGMTSYSLENRMERHLRDFEGRGSHNKKLQSIFEKHGWENMEFKVLKRLTASSKEKLKEKLLTVESRLIWKYKTNDKKFGYNKVVRGGYIRDKKTIRKLSKSGKEWVRNNPEQHKKRVKNLQPIYKARIGCEKFATQCGSIPFNVFYEGKYVGSYINQAQCCRDFNLSKGHLSGIIKKLRNNEKTKPYHKYTFALKDNQQPSLNRKIEEGSTTRESLRA